MKGSHCHLQVHLQCHHRYKAMLVSRWTPVTDLQAVSSDSEVEIANAALNLTADVPCHDETDSDYHSESDVDDNIFF